MTERTDNGAHFSFQACRPNVRVKLDQLGFCGPGRNIAEVRSAGFNTIHTFVRGPMPTPPLCQDCAGGHVGADAVVDIQRDLTGSDALSCVIVWLHRLQPRQPLA